MSDMWSAEHLLQVVQARIESGPDEARTPMHAVLEGADILVTFHWGDEPELYGVRFPTTDAPEGASTGEACTTAQEWAHEVALVLMEELDTGLVTRGRRSSNAQGLVELHYRPDR